MSARAMQLREGVAPTRERLTTTLFMAALVHGVIIVGVTFGSDLMPSGVPRGLEVIIVSNDVPEARSNDTAAYLAQRTQLGSGNVDDPNEASSLRAAAEAAHHDGRADGSTLQDDAGALLVDADNRVLTTAAPMPEILYFAPPSSMTEMSEVPLYQEGNNERDKLGVDDLPDQKVRGPERDDLWVTPDTRESVRAPYLVAWRTKVERLGTMHYPLAAWRAPATRSPEIKVTIRADGTLEEASILVSSGSPKLDQAALNILKLASPFDPFPKALSDAYPTLEFSYRWEFEGGPRSRGMLTAPADSQ
jgi:protein TonB